MKIRVKLNKEDYKDEVISKEKIEEAHKKKEEHILQKAKGVKDLKELRELMGELGENFEWEESTSRWLKESKPFEFVCINMKCPGLDVYKQRYIFWGVMAFSKAPVEALDHLGDLERILFEKDMLGRVYAMSTVMHGFLNQFWEKIGKFDDINDMFEDDRFSIFFEPGDHSISIDKKELNLKLMERGFQFPDLPYMARKAIAQKVNNEYSYINIPAITHNQLETDLNFPFYEFAASVVQLDRIINKEMQKFSLFEKLKNYFIRFFKPKPTFVDLNFMDILTITHNIIWRYPMDKMDNYMKNLLALMKLYSKKPRFKNKDFIKGLETVLDTSTDLIEGAHFLTWQSFSKKGSYKRKMKVKQIEDMSENSMEAVAIDIETILKKPLEDIGYPERAKGLKKGMRLIIGFLGGHVFRIGWLLRKRANNLLSLVFSKVRKFPIPYIKRRPDKEPELPEIIEEEQEKLDDE